MTRDDEQARHAADQGGFRDWQRLLPRSWALDILPYGAALLTVALALGVALLLIPFAGTENVDLVFLIAVIVVAARYGLGPSLAACVFSVLTYKFFFIPPIHGLVATDPGNIVTLFFFLVATVFTGHLAARARADALDARRHAATTEALYAFSRKIAGVVTLDDLLQVTRERIASMMRLDAAVWLPDAEGRLQIRTGGPPAGSRDDLDAEAHRVWDEGRSTPGSRRSHGVAGSLFHPLRTSRGPVGVIAVTRDGVTPRLTAEEERLLGALLDQATFAIERIRLAAAMDAARLAAETERLRTALLSSLSHDLKTPLASITGASTSLRQYSELYDAAAREELAATIQGEAERLSRFVANLLDMTRLKAGGIELKREPVDLGEVVGAALQRMQGVLGEHQITVDLPSGLPMLDLDVVLFEQVLVNLLDNAAKYSPPGSRIAIGAACDGEQVELTVGDEGPGIPPGDLERVFEMFHRVTKGDRQRAGTGLGLSICRGFVDVLGGTIAAANRIDGPGTIFTITFPRSVFTSLPQEDAAE